MYVKAKQQFQNAHRSAESNKIYFLVVLSLFMKVKAWFTIIHIKISFTTMSIGPSF